MDCSSEMVFNQPDLFQTECGLCLTSPQLEISTFLKLKVQSIASFPVAVPDCK